MSRFSSPANNPKALPLRLLGVPQSYHTVQIGQALLPFTAHFSVLASKFNRIDLAPAWWPLTIATCQTESHLFCQWNTSSWEYLLPWPTAGFSDCTCLINSSRDSGKFFPLLSVGQDVLPLRPANCWGALLDWLSVCSASHFLLTKNDNLKHLQMNWDWWLCVVTVERLAAPQPPHSGLNRRRCPAVAAGRQAGRLLLEC